MLQRFHGLYFALAMLAVHAVAQAEEPIVLRYKMKPGDQHIYRTKVAMTQSQTVNGMEIETKIEQQDVALRTVEKVDEKGNYLIKSQNKQLQVSTQIGPLGEYKFNSKTGERTEGSNLSTALNPLYDRLKDASLNFKLSPQGEILEVKGYQELLGDVVQQNPLAAQFAGGGGDEAAKLGFQQMYVKFPEKPLKPGDTWEETAEVPLRNIGKVESKSIYTYEGADTVGDRKTVRIRVSNDTTVDINIEMGGTKVSGKMTTTQSSGKVQFDPVAGQIILKEVSYTIDGDLTVDANGNIIDVESSQTQEVSVELLDKLPE